MSSAMRELARTGVDLSSRQICLTIELERQTYRNIRASTLESARTTHMLRGQIQRSNRKGFDRAFYSPTCRTA